MRCLILFAFASCHEPAKAPPPATTTIADANVAIAPLEASAPPPLAQTPKCVAPAIQPGACVPPLGDMNEDAIGAWLKARGAPDDANYEACRETPFGSEQALVCTRQGHVAIDRALGIAGPVEMRRELTVVVVRAKKRVELVVLPLDFGVGDTVTFSARFAVDKAGTLDLVLGADECADAKKELATWIAEEIQRLRDNDGIEPPFKKQLIAATNLEKTSDELHLALICKSTGHYLLREGKLVKP